MNIGLSKFEHKMYKAIAVMINITLFLEKSNTSVGKYVQSLPNTTTSFQHATLMENKISKTTSTTKETKRDRAYQS